MDIIVIRALFAAVYAALANVTEHDSEIAELVEALIAKLNTTENFLLFYENNADLEHDVRSDLDQGVSQCYRWLAPYGVSNAELVAVRKQLFALKQEVITYR